MSNVLTRDPSVAPNPMPAKTRKPYHAPKMESYGAVSALTRSGTPPGFDDAQLGYNSVPG